MSLALAHFRNLCELVKARTNRGLRPNIYFWRDHVGHEVDCIVDQGRRLIPIEIKSGQTVSPDFLKGIVCWRSLSSPAPKESYVVYGGDSDQERSEASVLGWKSFLKEHPNCIVDQPDRSLLTPL